MADGSPAGKQARPIPERLLDGLAMALRTATTAAKGIEALRRDVAGLRADVAALRTAVERGAKSAQDTRGAVASESEMDAFGDAAKVGFMPRDWKDGGDFGGSLMSECPPRFLSVLAEALDSMADKPKAGKEKYVPDNRRNARIARAWSLRNKAKAVALPVPAAPKTDPSPGSSAPADDSDFGDVAEDDGDF